jgi:hypothetical protein
MEQQRHALKKLLGRRRCARMSDVLVPRGRYAALPCAPALIGAIRNDRPSNPYYGENEQKNKRNHLNSFSRYGAGRSPTPS